MRRIVNHFGKTSVPKLFFGLFVGMFILAGITFLLIGDHQLNFYFDTFISGTR